MNSEIQAVFWDFGGVLTSSPFDAFNRFEMQRGLPKDFIRTVNATNPHRNAWAALESNQITLAEFDRVFAEESRALGHEIPGSQVVQLLGGDLRPAMVAVLKKVKLDYRTACLTNNIRSGEGPGMQQSAARAEAVREVMDLFDLVVESSRIGIRKPEPEFYTYACEQLAVAPTQVVFLDDLGINLKPARVLGMRTIKVVREDQAIRDLAELLQLELP